MHAHRAQASAGYGYIFVYVIFEISGLFNLTASLVKAGSMPILSTMGPLLLGIELYVIGTQ